MELISLGRCGNGTERRSRGRVESRLQPRELDLAAVRDRDLELCRLRRGKRVYCDASGAGSAVYWKEEEVVLRGGQGGREEEEGWRGFVWVPPAGPLSPANV
jgi:hypothetical protein